MKKRDYKVYIPKSHDRIEIPELSKWRVHLFEGLFYHPIVGKEPSRFHRIMHWLLLGFKWEKTK